MKIQLNAKVSHGILLPALLILCTITLQAQVEYDDELSGKEYNVGFLLTWSTSSETNNQLFAVERSTDGGEFKTIGSVESNTERGVNEYQFKDLELGLENASYRLKQVGEDGSYSYSSQLALKKEFVSYFNVVKKEKITNELFQVSVNTIKEGEIECRLTNNMGDILMEELKDLKIGLNDYIFDLQSEVDGKYSLILKLDNEMEAVLFIKETKDKKGNVASKKPVSGGG